jgi:endonuclease-3
MHTLESESTFQNTVRAQKVQEILHRLYKVWPNPSTELLWTTPLELIIATVLSAQCTDKVVNTVTPNLFAHFLTAQDYAESTPQEIDTYIRRINFHNTKARHLHGLGLALVSRYDGRVPQTTADLMTLPGVAKKTANVVLSEAFGIHQGIAVDTHVARLSQQLGLTTHKDPLKIEQDLMCITPQNQWRAISHLLILYGRYYAPARKPFTDPILADLKTETLHD